MKGVIRIFDEHKVRIFLEKEDAKNFIHGLVKREFLW